jgi:hypothetical protein
MYEGALPKTGLAVGVAGVSFGLSWIIGIALLLLVVGVLLVRYGGRHSETG